MDTTVTGTSRKVLPEPPLLTSHPDYWPSIHAELHRQPPHHMPFHTTNSTVLCLHTGDRIEEEWWFEGQYYTKEVSYNQMTLYPAYLERSIRWKAQKSFLVLCLQENFAEEILGDDSSFSMPRLVPQLGIHDPFVRELGQLFRQQLEHGNGEQPLYIDSLSLALGTYLTQHYSESSVSIQVYGGGLSANQVQQVHDYVDSHLSDAIRLKDLAQLLGMSAFHFS
ncbi:MAG: helix-turn-helix transcriptional regulator, partial [Acaryochloridaceae cyanobacterium RL_2_7]|nr:helix-turn-helix transcriptional regulator [Acaryochloridaceae cyanobacterium RL_2_7]